jgi:hypothetical protein
MAKESLTNAMPWHWIVMSQLSSVKQTTIPCVVFTSICLHPTKNLSKNHDYPMKIRWYHWLVYRVFCYCWNPILRDNQRLRHEIISKIDGGSRDEHIEEMDKLK